MKQPYLMRSVSTLFVLLFVAFIINSCKKDAGTQQEAANPEVSAARLWYERTYPQKTGGNFTTLSTTTPADLTQRIRPDWPKGLSYHRLNDDVVEIPIDASSRFSSAFNMGATGNPIYKKENSRSSFLLFKKGDGYEAYLMTIIADTAYLKSDRSKLDNNTYRKHDADFSGIVIYSTPKGKFVCSYGYRNGHLLPAKAAKKSVSSSKKAQDIERDPFAPPCIYWYWATYEDGVLVSVEFMYKECPEDGNGGGGTSTTTVECPPLTGTGMAPKYQVLGDRDPIGENPPPDPGDGGYPPPVVTHSNCIVVEVVDSVEVGISELNGEQDPDFPSNCASWAYTSAVNGNYQVCGVKDLRFDYLTEYQTGSTLHVDYFRGTFTRPLYFEFPQIRADNSIISASEAARLTALAKDAAEEILESQVESSPPPSTNAEVQLMLNRFYKILKSRIEAFGGRVTYYNNYGTTSLRTYSKTLGGGGC